jgi:hypothetical protein
MRDVRAAGFGCVPSTQLEDLSVPASLRDRKKLRTRRTIQVEALRRFKEKGTEATTVEEIAAAAEVAPANLLPVLPTKESRCCDLGILTVSSAEAKVGSAVSRHL